MIHDDKDIKMGRKINKPDRATMRPDCVSAWIDHVTYMERQMDEQRLSKHVG